MSIEGAMSDKVEHERRGRGRPLRSTERIQDMRAHIAACALRLFQQEGYAAVSMRKLAAEAGCTTSTVYAYYAGKIDILNQLWSEVFTTLFDGLDALAAAHSEPTARLDAVAQGYVDFWLQHGDHYFMVFMSRGIARADVEGYVASGLPRERFDLFVRCITDALGAPADADAVRQKSEALLCALNGISQALITISGHDWSAPDVLVRIAVDGVLKA